MLTSIPESLGQEEHTCADKGLSQQQASFYGRHFSLGRQIVVSEAAVLLYAIAHKRRLAGLNG